MTPNTVHVTVDPELCMGSGTCIAVAPDLFDIGKEGTAEPRQPVTAASEQLSRAISRCPTAAIHMTGRAH